MWNVNEKRKNVLRKIIMMVGVAHEMTSEFNQMAEHHHQKCLRQKKNKAYSWMNIDVGSESKRESEIETEHNKIKGFYI